MRTLIALLLVALGLASASPTRAQTPDLSPWDGVWFKTKVKEKGMEFHATQPGTRKEAFGGTVYLQLHHDGTSWEIGVDVWVQEESGWVQRSLTGVYVAGAADDVLFVLNQIPVSPIPVTDQILNVSFTARLSGTLSGGTVEKGKLKTLGGYFVEIDDAPGSDLRASGSLALSGKSTTKLPAGLPQD
jgi:hypothetical protein